jgi:hypothetical protein
MWRNLGQLSLFQSYCGMNHIGLFTELSNKRQQTAQRQVFAVGVGAGAEDILSGVETFFLKQIEHTRHGAIASFAYGAIYQGLGPRMLIGLRSRGMRVIPMFLLFLIFGYSGKFGDIWIWIPFLLSIGNGDYQVHSTLLLTRGRVQRYIAAMSSLLFTTVTTLGIIFVFLGMTRIVEPFMPAIHFRGWNADFHTEDWRLWYLFVAGVPLVALLRLLFWNRFIWATNIAVIGGLIGVMFPIIRITGFNMQIPGGWIALTLITAWGTFAAYLYRVCFQKSLATQK